MSEPTIRTTEQLEAAFRQITFANTCLDFKWRLHCHPVGVVSEETPQPGASVDNSRNGWLVWASFERPDTITGAIGRGRGRDEIVWEGAPLSGVVKTCWLLVELLVRHELMEGFRWDGARIFNPHNTVTELAAIQRD